MKVRDIGEFGLIRRIDRAVSRKRSFARDLLIGIGDDAAVWRPRAHQVATVDTLAEDVHFTREFCSWTDVGWKAMAVNLSDIAAMGAMPRWALVALTLPETTGVGEVKSLFRGMTQCGQRQDIHIVGGNLTRGPKVILSVTVIGEAPASELWKRDGARQGDVIAVTGRLGEAAAGLEALRHGVRTGSAVRRYRRPRPRNDLQRLLKKGRVRVHAAIDLSDGLASDLRHVCEASDVGAQIDLGKIPVARSAVELGRRFQKDSLDWALHGGEDYELLLWMTASDFRKARTILRNNITQIGVATRSRRIDFLRNGIRTDRQAIGFRHF